MRILVTAGNTQTPVDQVRCITNIFTGKTGGRIAQVAHDRGHDVTLFTSHPEAIDAAVHRRNPTPRSWQVQPYRTFDDLRAALAESIPKGEFDAIIHAAAVSDYRIAGIHAPAAGTSFDATKGSWTSSNGVPQLIDAGAGKVKSHYGDLWLHLVPTPKLVDMFRKPWGYAGVLVKFKLEVDKSDADLLRIAEASRVESDANFVVANTLEGMHDWAFLGPFDDGYRKVTRADLATRVLVAIEQAVAQ